MPLADDLAVSEVACGARHCLALAHARKKAAVGTITTVIHDRGICAATASPLHDTEMSDEAAVVLRWGFIHGNSSRLTLREDWQDAMSDPDIHVRFANGNVEGDTRREYPYDEGLRLCHAAGLYSPPCFLFRHTPTFGLYY